MSPWTPLRRLLAAAVVAALASTALVTAAGARPDPAGSDDGPAFVELPVSFEVRNVNRTAIPCEADGRTYTLEGVMTVPVAALKGDDYDAVTLVVHGLGYGAFFSNFEEVEGYDFAAKAVRAGNVTVAIDRLGYGDSPQPDGFGICFGSHADMAHQVVDQLRSGAYRAGSIDAPAFDSVVLAGHSVGGLIAEATAYTFDNVDGLVVLSWSDVVMSELAMDYAARAVEECETTGGKTSEEGAPGYVAYGATELDFVIGHFATGHAPPEVITTTAERRNINPCGDLLSFGAAVETNLANVGRIDVPVLVLTGLLDNFFPAPASVRQQTPLYTGTDDVTGVVLPATGHALTLHDTRNLFAADVKDWLRERGLSGPPVGPNATVPEPSIRDAIYALFTRLDVLLDRIIGAPAG